MINDSPLFCLFFHWTSEWVSRFLFTFSMIDCHLIRRHFNQMINDYRLFWRSREKFGSTDTSLQIFDKGCLFTDLYCNRYIQIWDFPKRKKLFPPTNAHRASLSKSTWGVSSLNVADVERPTIEEFFWLWRKIYNKSLQIF